MTDTKQLSFWGITLRAIVVHTITYSLVGLLALVFFDYGAQFSEPPLSYFMRQTNDPLVAAGVLFQPLRGFLFGVVFYLLRGSLFQISKGWISAWAMLVIVGIFSTFAPALGSIEGFIYTTIPLEGQLDGLTEVLIQSLLLSALTIYWVKNAQVRWLNWVLNTLFVIALLLPLLGLLAGQATTT
jgi:hypothetical protein